jgi:hypothetical protein
MAGLRAMARASRAIHSFKTSAEEVIPCCDGHWMALTICECLIAAEAA